MKVLSGSLMLFGFGFVLNGKDTAALMTALLLILFAMKCAGTKGIMEHWDTITLLSLAELVLIEKSGLVLSYHSLFVMAFSSLIHAYTWCSKENYQYGDCRIYEVFLIGSFFVAVCIPSLPFGFGGTLLILAFAFLPYIYLGRKVENCEFVKKHGKNALTVIK